MGANGARKELLPSTTTEGSSKGQTVTPVLGEATIQELREAVRGEVVTAADDGYADACRIWNGAHPAPQSPVPASGIVI